LLLYLLTILHDHEERVPLVLGTPGARGSRVAADLYRA
jgi:hypothetical protein